MALVEIKELAQRLVGSFGGNANDTLGKQK